MSIYKMLITKAPELQRRADFLEELKDNKCDQFASGMLNEKDNASLYATYALAANIDQFKPIKIPANYFHDIMAESLTIEDFRALPFESVFLEFEKPFGELKYSCCTIIRGRDGISMHFLSKESLNAIKNNAEDFALAHHLPIYPDEEIFLRDLQEPVAKILSNIKNILNVFDSDNVKIMKSEYRHSKKERRRSKGGYKLPEHYYEIEVDGERVKYEKDYQQSGRTVSYMFDVRGHFRTYKNGKKKWIAPYKKGSGVYIPRSYKLKPN